MDESHVLDHMGLSDEDLTDYLAKFAAFHGSLNDAQKRFAARAKPSTDLQADCNSVGGGATPAAYTAFLQSRGAPSDAPAMFAPLE